MSKRSEDISPKKLFNATTRMNLKNIMLSKISQSQKTTILHYLLYEMFRSGRSIETENTLVVAQECGVGGERIWGVLMGTKCLLGMMRMFWN